MRILISILFSALLAAASAAQLPKIIIAPNHRTFQTSDQKAFVPLGVTYYRPGTGWAPQVWKQFDAEATRRDFARMKEAGVNCVRVFLSYGSFCNTPGKLDPNGLAKFDQFLEIAESAGIYVHPTGPDHWEGTPDWARADRIADEQTLSGLETFWKQFASRFRDRNVIFAYDLRNEPEVLWDTPPMRAKWIARVKTKYATLEAAAKAWNISAVSDADLIPPRSGKSPERELLDYQLSREQLADDWTRRQVAAIKSADPRALVTVGLIQWSVPSCLPRAEHYSAFRPERQAPFLDFLEIHFYPLDHGAFEYRDEESEGRNLAYLENVVAEAARPGKPLVLAEFGWYGGGKPKFDNGRHPFASEEQQARWCRRVVESTAGLAVGWLNWGFYDQPEATDCSEFTGLFTADAKMKAWGREFQKLSARYSGKIIPTKTLSPRPQLDWNRAILDPAAGNRFRAEYYAAWKKDSGAAPASSTRTHVEPRAIEDLLANPGMGWQTFHRFADEDKNLQGLPSGSAYFRFYWREIEKEDGKIDFAKFDELLAHARRAGQKLAFRIMCTGSGDYSDCPLWLKEQGCKGVEFEYGGRKHWVPDFSDPIFQEKHFRLFRELGRRYDGHPDLDLLDIGSVGLWGEWHMSGTTAIDTGKPVPMPSPEIQNRIIDEWRRAFPKTSKVVLIGSLEGMRRAARDRLGWRADCLGDMGGFSKTWNHMNDFYLQQIARAGATNAWQAAPVAFESCWDMRKWKEANWDVPFIFDYALRVHASYVNNKSAPIPEGTRGDIEKFLRHLGYRLVIRGIDHDATVRPGENLHLSIAWENLGVAPPYRDDRVAIRISKNDAPPKIITSETSIRGWLPGPRSTELSIPISESTTPGNYQLAIGIVEPGAPTPAVRLANEGRDNTGWYPVSAFSVAAANAAN